MLLHLFLKSSTSSENLLILPFPWCSNSLFYKHSWILLKNSGPLVFAVTPFSTSFWKKKNVVTSCFCFVSHALFGVLWCQASISVTLPKLSSLKLPVPPFASNWVEMPPFGRNLLRAIGTVCLYPAAPLRLLVLRHWLPLPRLPPSLASVPLPGKCW